MHCKKCGTALTDDAAFCPSCGAKAKKRGKKPFFLIRFFLHLMSLLLYLALMVSLLATALLADVNILTSSGGIEAIMTHLVTTDGTTPSPTSPSTSPAMGSAGVMLLSATDLPGDVQIPDDVTTDSGALADFIQDMAGQILGEDAAITPEQIQTFIQKSNIMEFVADKAASMVGNILSGKTDTAPIITTEDILQLVDDNQQLIEDIFRVEITEESKQEMAGQIDTALADADINAMLQEGITQALQTPVPGTDGMTVQEFLVYIQQLAQPKVIIFCVAACLLMMGLLGLLNYYNLPGGIRWIGSACTTAGALLATPLAIVQFSPALVAGLMPETGETLQLISGAASVIAPVHYGLLAMGIVLMIVSFTWRLFTRNR